MASRSQTRRVGYSSAAIFLHWTIAILILTNIGLAWTWDTFQHSPDPAQKAIGDAMVDWHKSFGLTVLGLSLVRLILRVVEGFPPLPAGMQTWERVLARTTHVFFYVLIIVTPALGWALASSGKYPLALYGIPFPKLPIPQDRALGHQIAHNHGLAATLILFTLALHVVGALKHQLLNKDWVIHRMLPWVKQPARG